MHTRQEANTFAPFMYSFNQSSICAIGIHPSGDRYTGETHKVAETDKREEWILTPGDSQLAACEYLRASMNYNSV